MLFFLYNGIGSIEEGTVENKHDQETPIILHAPEKCVKIPITPESVKDYLEKSRYLKISTRPESFSITRPYSKDAAMLPTSSLRPRLEHIVSQIDDLPTLPDVVIKMLALIDRMDTSVPELSQVVSKDPVFTMKIIKMANSRFYGFPRQISTVDMAVVALGFKQLKCLALSLSVVEQFDQETMPSGFDLEKFWEHSIGCGIAGRMLAKEFGYQVGAEAFVAGLLHNIGKLFLCQHCPREFNEINLLVQEGGLSFLAAERAVIDVTHAELGQWLAVTWNLPVELSDAIAYHHNPAEAEHHPELACLVHFADILCRIFSVGYGGDTQIPAIEDDAVSILMTDHPTQPLIDEALLISFQEKFMKEFEQADVLLSLTR